MAALPTNLANRVSQSSSRQLMQRIITAQYGEGYEQTAAIGINSRYDEWTLNFEALNASLRTEFLNFYTTVGLTQSWDWTPPGGVAGKYRIIEPPTESNNGFYSNFSMKVKQVFS